jgi:mycofactocin system glycosyltransferase
VTEPSGATPATDRLPDGFGVRMSPHTETRDAGRTLIGGDRGGVLYLSPRAADLLDDDGVLRVRDATSATLGRLLLDRGFGVPWWAASPPAGEPVDDVTVVIPVRDRPTQLGRLLAHLPPDVPVIVVDDGSADPAACAAVCRANGAVRLVHHRSRGPAGARNTGLAAVSTPFVAFVDSDVVPDHGWLAGLRRHFEDPAVGAAAPRVLGLEATGTPSWIGRYEAVRSSLDLGPTPAGVRPHARVSYLPGACLMVRAAAVGRGFDPRLRVAEDVDLVWRLTDRGWRVRYDPALVVRHDHRIVLRSWLARKAFYGTGASPLARRHGAAVAPLVVTAPTVAVVVALALQRPWSLPVAAAVHAALVVRIRRRLRHSGAPTATAVHLANLGVRAAGRQVASALVRQYWPAAAVIAVRSGRMRRAMAVAAVADAAVDHRESGASLDLLRFGIARRMDDLAYGAGLWVGVLRARSPAALVPVVRGLGRARRVRAGRTRPPSW